MRHRLISNKFGRHTSSRKSLFKNLAISLIKYESIITTIHKAKYLRRFIEPLINRSKTNDLHSKRLIFKKIQNRQVVNKIFNITSKRYKSRNGGYTRIIRYKYRRGDGACMAIMSLV